MSRDDELTREALRYLHLALHCLKGVSADYRRQILCNQALKLLIVKVERLLGAIER